MSNSVSLYVAGGGNHFMVELATLYLEGFRALGVEADLRVDVVPAVTEENDGIHLIVAPHEFIPLFLAGRLSKPAMRELLRNVYVINTEQPGSSWFEAAFACARQCRGTFDMNRLGVAEFERRGIPAVYISLGYANSIEDCGVDPPAEKDIDIVFLGHFSQRREMFLAQNAALLQTRNCYLTLSDVSGPRRTDHPTVVSGVERNRILRRSRILVNVHSANRRYFEWLRALQCMANHCMVVSEISEGTDPLVDGRHVAFAELPRLIDVCERYLSDDQARSRIADQAYDFLKGQLPIEVSCRTILEQAPSMHGRRRRTLSQFARHAGLLAKHGARLGASVARYPVHLLLRRRSVQSAFIKAQSYFDRRRGHWSLEEIEQRRRDIVGRLDAIDRNRADHTLVANRRYEDPASPNVSVVITAYNYAAYLRGCLESVLASEAEGIPGGVEILVVDDASLDDSAHVAAAALRDARVPGLLIKKKRNTGLADARNVGVHLARAPYVFILDADNYVFPRCLAKLYHHIVESRSAAVYGIIQKFDNDTGAARGLMSYFGWDVSALLQGNYIDAMAMLDRDKLMSVGGYSTELIRHGWFGWEDYDLWLKFAAAGLHGSAHREIVAAYRVHDKSMIKTTLHYTPAIARHFESKFAGLVRDAAPSDRRFGLRVT